MPWQEVSVLEQRLELVQLAVKEGANVTELARRFGVSRPTAYKWIRRFEVHGAVELHNRSRRPHRSPERTPETVESAILEVRRQHPTWGSRLIRSYLDAQGVKGLPSASTVHAILKRHGQIANDAALKHRAWQRFEHDAPNDLWQMDFKGHFPMRAGRCHPLTVIDDHSRFALAVEACSDETAATVQTRVIGVFRRWGMPLRLLMDNGNPWGYTQDAQHTRFSAWLMRLGIQVIHGRPRHPQTQGKLERFHRTLKAEAINGIHFEDLEHAQRAFDRFRYTYNNERPHTALNFTVPAGRYTMSTMAFPEVMPSIEYGPDDLVRKVCDKGKISFEGRSFRVGKAFRRQHVALRPTTEDGTWKVFYCQTQIATINLHRRTNNRGNV